MQKKGKIGANLEAKIGTYLKVKHCAKWDAKVVEQMDAILDVNLDANMVIMGMHLGNKSGYSLGRKIGHF